MYRDKIQESLGVLWEWLPEGAIDHDPYAYLKADSASRGSRQDEERSVA
jgi:hypothetical protein